MFICILKIFFLFYQKGKAFAVYLLKVSFLVKFFYRKELAMAISSVGALSVQTGLATGLDTGSLIDSMIQAESAPINIMQRSKTSMNQQKASLQTLQSKLEVLYKIAAEMDGMNATLTGRSKSEEFLRYSTNISDQDLLSLSPGEGAKNGSYSIEIQELAQEGRVAHNGFSKNTDILSSENAVFALKIGTEEKTINIKGGITTLDDLKNAINDLDANASASIINTGEGTNPYRLVISGTKTGLENSISIGEGTTLEGFKGLNFAETQSASNALIKINGVNVSRSENSFSDVLEGITVTLKGKTKVDEKIQASVEINDTAIKGKIESFLGAFNDALSYLEGQSYNKEKKTSGILSGDHLVLSTQSRLRNFISKPISIGGGKKVALSELGIKTGEDGKLKLDDTKFSEALKTKFQDVRTAFSGNSEENGVAGTLSNFLKSFLKDGGGIIQGRTASLEASSKRMDTQISKMQARLEQRRATLLSQFTSMERAVSSIQTNQTTLSQYFWSTT